MTAPVSHPAFITSEAVMLRVTTFTAFIAILACGPTTAVAQESTPEKPAPVIVKVDDVTRIYAAPVDKVFLAGGSSGGDEVERDTFGQGHVHD